MRLTARFYVRGGIFTTVAAQHAKAGWDIGSLPPLEDSPASRSTR
jgi:7-cyano-7-deazaguanine reductase